MLKSKACDRRKRAVAPLSCAELAELVTNLVNILTDGVDKYDKSVGYNWPASTVLRICGFIEESLIDKEDCDDADLAVRRGSKGQRLCKRFNVGIYGATDGGQ